MAINRDYLGRTYPVSEPYEVSRVKIGEFADAIGDPSLLYRDAGAAQAAGYPDVIAPPPYPMVVHGEERFEYSRQLTAGDVVTAEVTISDIRTAGRNVLLTTRTEIRTVDGEHVCTAHSTLAERGAAQ